MIQPEKIVEIIIKGFLIESLGNIKKYNLDVNKGDSKMIYGKLEEQNKKAIDILKRLKKSGKINSIYIPKNKKIQKELNELVETKREIKKSLNKLKQLYT
jgi:hypothetical protein